VIRNAQRPLSHYAVVGGVDLAVGTTDRGAPAVSIRPSGTRSGVQNITDVRVLDQLVEELNQARQHLLGASS
jgi:hypothetical protein